MMHAVGALRDGIPPAVIRDSLRGCGGIEGRRREDRHVAMAPQAALSVVVEDRDRHADHVRCVPFEDPARAIGPHHAVHHLEPEWMARRRGHEGVDDVVASAQHPPDTVVLPADDRFGRVEQVIERPDHFIIEIRVDTTEAMQVRQSHQVDPKNARRCGPKVAKKFRVVLGEQSLVVRVVPEPVFPRWVQMPPRILEAAQVRRDASRLPGLVDDFGNHESVMWLEGRYRVDLLLKRLHAGGAMHPRVEAFILGLLPHAGVQSASVTRHAS